MALSLIDWLMIATVAASAFIGLRKGFVRELTSIAIWGAIFVVALFLDDFSALSQRIANEQEAHPVLVFCVLLAGIVTAGSLIGVLAFKLVRTIGLGEADRIFGLLLGVCRSILVIAVFVVFLPRFTAIETTNFWLDSQFIPQIAAMEDDLLNLAKRLGAFIERIMVKLLY